MTTEMISLAIVVGWIVLFVWRPIPNAVTACLGCLMFALTGVCTLDKAISGFSNSTVLLMFGMMVVGIALMDTGAAKLIGRYVAKISEGREKRFILLAGTVSAIMSTFLSNTAVIAIFLPIIASASQTNASMNRKNMTLPVTMGAMFGGVCTLVGSTPQLTANGILEEMTGKSLQMFDFLLPGLCLFAIYMLYVLTIGHRMGVKVWGNTEAVEASAAETATEEIVVDKKKMLIMCVIFAITIVLFIGGWISTSMTAVLAALLCVITGCTTQKSIIKKMDWSVVFILAGCLGIAAGITSGGLGDMMSDLMSNIISPDVPALAVFAFFVFATMLISNFITNSTAVVITLPIVLSLCTANGYNPVAFTLGIVYAANLVYSMPLANAQTAMTLVAGYKFSDYIKYTWLLNILVFTGIIIAVPVFFPLV